MEERGGRGREGVYRYVQVVMDGGGCGKGREEKVRKKT
jgi:hypothetical protein